MSAAPGEGKKPIHILTDKYFEGPILSSILMAKEDFQRIERLNFQ